MLGSNSRKRLDDAFDGFGHFNMPLCVDFVLRDGSGFGLVGVRNNRYLIACSLMSPIPVVRDPRPGRSLTIQLRIPPEHTHAVLEPPPALQVLAQHAPLQPLVEAAQQRLHTRLAAPRRHLPWKRVQQPVQQLPDGEIRDGQRVPNEVAPAAGGVALQDAGKVAEVLGQAGGAEVGSLAAGLGALVLVVGADGDGMVGVVGLVVGVEGGEDEGVGVPAGGRVWGVEAELRGEVEEDVGGLGNQEGVVDAEAGGGEGGGVGGGDGRGGGGDGGLDGGVAGGGVVGDVGVGGLGCFEAGGGLGEGTGKGEGGNGREADVLAAARDGRVIEEFVGGMVGSGWVGHGGMVFKVHKGLSSWRGGSSGMLRAGGGAWAVDVTWGRWRDGGAPASISLHPYACLTCSIECATSLDDRLHRSTRVCLITAREVYSGSHGLQRHPFRTTPGWGPELPRN